MQDIVILAMAVTSFAKTVDALLRANHDTTLQDFIVSRRKQRKSYGQIAAELNTITDGTVEVSRQTVVNWATELLEVAS